MRSIIDHEIRAWSRDGGDSDWLGALRSTALETRAGQDRFTGGGSSTKWEKAVLRAERYVMQQITGMNLVVLMRDFIYVPRKFRRRTT